MSTFVLEGFARRWCLEVTFHDVKQFLGFEDAQHQAEKAVRRTAPMACIVYDLVVLWYSQQIVSGRSKGWLAVPWCRRKSKPSFWDMLTAARRAGWRLSISDPPSGARRRRKSVIGWHEAVLATA